MANQEHIELLNQEVEEWNEGRKKHPETLPNLSHANLSNVNLGSRWVRDEDGTGVYQIKVNLSNADLNGANLRGINLHNANMFRSNLILANLSSADLNGTNPYLTDLSHANMSGTNLQGASANYTIFADINLQSVKRLTEIRHEGPSPIKLHTVQLPQEGSPLHFLRGAGVPEEWVDLYRAQMMSPIQYHSCFISYSSKDDILARRSAGSRCALLVRPRRHENR